MSTPFTCSPTGPPRGIMKERKAAANVEPEPEQREPTTSGHPKSIKDIVDHVGNRARRQLTRNEPAKKVVDKEHNRVVAFGLTTKPEDTLMGVKGAQNSRPPASSTKAVLELRTKVDEQEQMISAMLERMEELEKASLEYEDRYTNVLKICMSQDERIKFLETQLRNSRVSAPKAVQFNDKPERDVPTFPRDSVALSKRNRGLNAVEVPARLNETIAEADPQRHQIVVRNDIANQSLPSTRHEMRDCIAHHRPNHFDEEDRHRDARPEFHRRHRMRHTDPHSNHSYVRQEITVRREFHCSPGRPVSTIDSTLKRADVSNVFARPTPVSRIEEEDNLWDEDENVAPHRHYPVSRIAGPSKRFDDEIGVTRVTDHFTNDEDAFD